MPQAPAIFVSLAPRRERLTTNNGGATRAEAIDPVVDPVDPVDPVNPIFYFLFYFLNKMKFNHNHKLRMKR